MAWKRSKQWSLVFPPDWTPPYLHIGSGREGNIHVLMDLGEEENFGVYGVPELRVGGEVVSSTRIREAVRRELSSLPAVDLVLVARASAAQAATEDFRSWLRRAAIRIGKEGAGR